MPEVKSRSADGDGAELRPDDEAVPYSISMTREMIKKIDTRAKALNLNRSQYFAALALKDLRTGGPVTIYPLPNKGQKRAKREGQ